MSPQHALQKIGRVADVCLVAGALGLAWYMLSAQPVLSPDSPGYMYGAYCRAPLLPLLYRVFHPLFGESALRAMMILQSLAILGAGAIFARTLYSVDFCGKRMALFIFFVVCSLGAIFSRYILAEALCYAVAILYFSSFVAIVHSGASPTGLYPILFVGMLGRPQLIWLLVPHNLYILFKSLRQRQPLALVKSVLTSLALVIVVFLSAQGYNAVTLGHFAYTTLSGVHLFGNALYLSDESDATLFKDDPKQEAFFNDCLQEADRHKMRWKHWNGGYTPEGFFREYYAGETTFLYLTEYVLGAKHGLYLYAHPNEHEALRDVSLVTFNTACQQMAWKLIAQNPLGYAKHVYRKVLATRLAVVLTAIFLCLTAGREAILRNTPLAVIMAGVSLSLLGNYAMLGVGNILCSRYALASEVPFFILAGLYVLRGQNQSLPQVPPDPPTGLG